MNKIAPLDWTSSRLLHFQRTVVLKRGSIVSNNSWLKTQDFSRELHKPLQLSQKLSQYEGHISWIKVETDALFRRIRIFDRL